MSSHKKTPYVAVPTTPGEAQASDFAEEFEMQMLGLEDDGTISRHHQEEEDVDTQAEGQSSMSMAFMNMANSILGAGIIGQPFAFKNSGLLGGIVVLGLLTVLVDWTLRLIVVNANLSQSKSYQDTVSYCYGRWGKIVLLFAIGSFAYGGLMAFCVIIGDTIPHVLRVVIPLSVTDDGSPFSWLFRRNTVIIMFTTFISYPLSLNRDISKLAKASGLALVGMIIIVVITVVRGPMADSSLKEPLTPLQWTVNFNIFQGISVISFALVCHHNTLFIYNSLRNATVTKFAKLTHIACFVSMLCCLVMAVNGLINFGNATKGNILNNFKSNDNWINIARLCFGLNMLTTFPLELFVVRDVIKEIVLANQDGGSVHDVELSKMHHFLITTVLTFTSMSVALFTCNLGVILELIGATSASLMAYIIPPACYIKLSWQRKDYYNLSKPDKRKFLLHRLAPSGFCIFFGFAVMIISSIGSINSSLNSKDAGHCNVE
ncbi:uncharacterized protein KQ657_001316 [Scheffersomyces spartinae]|uniref:Amino acid transporter transmembrane domain-containing protein n=1 Tax=Scheffersomyces spartinae TaxID=45513 RepID=A0A9P7V7U4_9ASCO|nr:uncharacterized protein KQ657_001316 [Scheffersomyces spartinae]KAG7192859.1 hypothetical protein KQ657_001316 [Scheffersomyces spartinae]